jgi:hypothetical protein
LVAGSLLSARMRSFLGFTGATSAPAPHVVLLAPPDWRERMAERDSNVAQDGMVYEEILNVDHAIETPTVEPKQAVSLPVGSAPPVRAPSDSAQQAPTPAPHRLHRVEAPGETRRESRAMPPRVPNEPVARPRAATPTGGEPPSVASSSAGMPARPGSEPALAQPVLLENANTQPAEPHDPEVPDVTQAPNVNTPRMSENLAVEPPIAAASVTREKAEVPPTNAPNAPPAQESHPAPRTGSRAPRKPNEPAEAQPIEMARPADADVTKVERHAIPDEHSIRREPLASPMPPSMPTPNAWPKDDAAPEASSPLDPTHAASRAAEARQVESGSIGMADRVDVGSDNSAPPVASTKSPSAPAADALLPRATTKADAVQPTEVRRGRRPPSMPQTARPTETTNTAREQSQPARTSDAEEQTPSTDRALTEWRKLLFEATTPATKTGAPPAAGDSQKSPPSARAKSAPPATRPTTTTTPPRAAPPPPPQHTEPLRESTRRFLRPRVGIDPASVPIVRGQAADRLLGPDADAAAIGEAIVLPSTHDEQSPRTLGLIAHELTHVAQRRQPAFLPPVVRPSVDRPATSTGAPRRALPRPPSSEESLARHVEHIVVREAENAVADDTSIVDFGHEPVKNYSSPRSSDAPPVAEQSSEWGGLPAPWEPLAMPEFSSPNATQPASFAVPAPSFADDAPVHFADHGRPADEAPAAASAPQHPHDDAPPPDLDTLARHVYDVLKRRLAAERRREG